MVAIHTHGPLTSQTWKWAHLNWSANIPPIGTGSYNHLVWQLVQKNWQDNALIAQYNAQSFSIAQETACGVAHIEALVNRSVLNRYISMMRRLFNRTRQEPAFVKAMADLAQNMSCDQLMIWDGMGWAYDLRRRLPDHFMMFVQRHYRYPILHTDYRAFDLIIMQTRQQVKLAFERMNLIAGLIVVIPNGVELDIFCPASDQEKSKIRERLSLPEDKLVVILPSRIAPNKGTRYVEYWIQELADREPEICFLITGDFIDNFPGRHRKSLEKVLNTAANVRWIGGVARYDMPQYYQAADVALIPSTLYEGFSLASAEAMACGLPVIGPDTGHFPEIIYPAYNGVLFRQDYMLPDIPPILSQLQKRRVDVKQMGRNARQYAEQRLSRDKQIKNFEAVMDGRYNDIDEDLSVPD
jgi:glycosyltransferase involved in cell wall biosynthesis